MSRRARTGARVSENGGAAGGAKLPLHPPNPGVAAARGEGGGEGPPRPPAQLGSDPRCAARALRPPASPTPAAHGLPGTQKAAAGGTPGHCEGEAGVSARALPAPPGLALALRHLWALSVLPGGMERPLPTALVRP